MEKRLTQSELEFLNLKKPKNQFQGTKEPRLCILAGRYDNPIPIPALCTGLCFTEDMDSRVPLFYHFLNNASIRFKQK